jgi:hypothetical protein
MKKQWKYIVATIVFFGAALLSCAAYGDEFDFKLTLTQPGALIAAMSKGQVAPFDGVLYSKDAQAQLIAFIDAVPKKIRLEVDNANSTSAAQCTHQVNEQKIAATTEKRMAEIAAQEKAAQMNILNEQLKRAESSRANAPMWIAIGTVVGAVTAILAGFAIGYAAQAIK